MARTNINGTLLGKITGVVAGAGSITATDSVVAALGKLINARIVSVNVAVNTGGGSNTSAAFAALMNGPTVTPQSASNKFLVIFAGQMGMTTANQTGYFTFFKSVGGGGATNVVASTNGLTEVSTPSAFVTTPGCMIYLDSPATTSSVQYSVYGKTTGGGTQIICGTNETCTITVIELGIGN